MGWEQGLVCPCLHIAAKVMLAPSGWDQPVMLWKMLGRHCFV